MQFLQRLTLMCALAGGSNPVTTSSVDDFEYVGGHVAQVDDSLKRYQCLNISNVLFTGMPVLNLD